MSWTISYINLPFGLGISLSYTSLKVQYVYHVLPNDKGVCHVLAYKVSNVIA